MNALIAMSGGVDSSVAALLTKQLGYECAGCTMKLYDNDTAGIPRSRTCCSLEDVDDARGVACKLGMRYYVFNFKDDFRQKVISDFVSGYLNGLTPNPCIECNRHLKFGKLYNRADILGCEYIVTGHYARIQQVNGKYVLKKAIDCTKDQSYVLYFLTQEQLKRTLFPLGELCKSHVRTIAEKNGFINADKPDSQDICFVPDGRYADFVERYSGAEALAGNFVDMHGNVIGRHKGIIRYTIGQRKGLGVFSDRPLYVCGISAEKNQVTLGGAEDLLSREATAANFNWISGEIPAGMIRCRAKIRYRQTEQPATAFPLENGNVRIRFDEPQRAVTKGQAAVLYDGDTVLGGGTII